MQFMKAHTSRCADFEHAEFQVVFDSSLVTEPEVHGLLGKLESEVENGRRIVVGDAFQVGWIALQIRAHEDGSLVFYEPDMIHTPPFWVESVTHSLIHLRVQQGVCSSLEGAEEPAFVSQELPVRICEHLGESESFLMTRGEAGDGDSGWSVLCDRDRHPDDASDLFPVSLFEAVIGYEPRLLPYLGLPPGFAVDFRDNRPAISFEGSSVAFKAGSSLERMFGGG